MSNKRSARTKNIDAIIKSPRKRANNQIDSDFESHHSKRRRLDKNANERILCLPIDKRHFYHIQSLNAFLIENNNVADDSGDDDEYKSLYRQIHQVEINRRRFLSKGEKEMINLWNTFIESEPCFGLKHMRVICHRFVDAHIRDIVQKKLYAHWLRHLCLLNEAGLLLPTEYLSVVQHIQSCMGLGIEAFNGIVEAQKRKKTEQTKKKKRSRSSTNSDASDAEPKQKRYLTRSIKSTALG